MLRTNVYLTEDQERAIKVRAAIMNKPKAEILREVISHGLKATSVQKSASTATFLRLASIAKQFKGKGTGPKDLSANLDEYIWDE